MEFNAKCRYLKNWPLDFAEDVLSARGLLPSYDPYFLPPYTLYTCKQYTYSHRERGRVNQREG
jgi:hypothetical protein